MRTRPALLSPMEPLREIRLRSLVHIPDPEDPHDKPYEPVIWARWDPVLEGWTGWFLGHKDLMASMPQTTWLRCMFEEIDGRS